MNPTTSRIRDRQLQVARGRLTPLLATIAAVALSLVTVPGAYTLTAPAQRASSGSVTAMPKVDVCSLLTSDEIQSVLGEPLQEAKASSQASGALRTSQCLFLTPTPAKSVSLTIVTSGSPHSEVSLHEFWHHQFHPAYPDRDAETEKSHPAAPPTTTRLQHDETQEASKPRPITGLGDEAYWVGNPIIGALYVLQGPLFLRISIGGIPSEPARLAKCKALTSPALRRLRSRRPS